MKAKVLAAGPERDLQVDLEKWLQEHPEVTVRFVAQSSASYGSVLGSSVCIHLTVLYEERVPSLSTFAVQAGKAGNALLHYRDRYSFSLALHQDELKRELDRILGEDWADRLWAKMPERLPTQEQEPLVGKSPPNIRFQEFLELLGETCHS
ncbi:hypothetical protein HY464_01215 [Candidatus Peregrinibacteria bacterium]|nr:hypothetical protein [Candidatus Peregrinibacteria bacterium]